MNKKSGKAGTLVAPLAPKSPNEADLADVGGMAKIKAEQVKQKAGKFGTEKFKAFKPADAAEAAPEEEKKSWIEIELVDEDTKPVSGKRYRIKLPDDTVAEGTLDDKGCARVEGFVSGTCLVSFPELDQDAWTKA